MQNADVVIIGGGLGGLTAGATLSKMGVQVLLLEPHYIPGGCATTFKRKDYLMEVGLHEMDGLDEADPKKSIFEFLEIEKNVELLQVPELFRLLGAGQDTVYPHGSDASREALSQKFPEDAEAITALYKLMDGVRGEVRKIPSQKWKAKLLLPIFPLLFPNTVKASRSTLGDYLDKHFQNESLKLLLQANLVYYHDDPYTMSMVYFSLAQASYIRGGGHFIKGGSQKLSNYLADTIRANGGTVLLGKMATAINVTNGHTTGVTYRDAFNTASPETSIEASHVIGNAAVPLIAEMLPEPHRAKLQKQITPLEHACSLLTVYIGFKGDLKTLGSIHYSTFILPDELTSLRKFNENCHADFDKRGFVFVDYGQIDSGIAPDGKTFGCICSADYLPDWEHLDEAAYKAKKEQIVQKLFDRLEAFLPGSRAMIETYEVGTARTVKRYTRNPSGTPYGFAQIPSQAGKNRVSMRSPVKGLQFASAWTLPGGGFSAAIASGFLCAMDMKKTIKPVSQSARALFKDNRSVALRERRKIADGTFEMSFEKPVGFEPQSGQYAILSLENLRENQIDMPLRLLSIASHADEDVVRFAMRDSDSSFKQNCLNMELGERATIYGPTGDFVLPKDAKPTAFLVGGIGITPVMPMLKALQKTNFGAPTHLFYSNRKRDQAAYLDDLEAIQHDDFKLHTVLTETDPRIDQTLLIDRLGNLKDFTFYIIGTSEFLTHMSDMLIQNCVDPLCVFYDDFG